MSNFTPLVLKEYEFEGEKLKVEFSRMTRKDILYFLPKVRELSLAQDDEDKEAIQKVTMQILEDGLEILITCVKKFEGLKYKDTTHDIPITVIAEEMYFMNLALDIMMDILNASLVLEGGEVVKNV